MPVISNIIKCKDNCNYFNKIIVYFEDQSFITLRANIDCDFMYSAWFEEYYNNNFENCIGRNLIDIKETDKNNQHYNKFRTTDSTNDNILCEFIFSSGKKFKFLLKSSHNGFYSAWMTIHNKHNLKEFKTYPEKSVIFVVGLPGSGKSYFSKTLKWMKKQFEQKECILFDDNLMFSSTFGHDYMYSIEEASENIKNVNEKNPIIICNAKLCIKKFYKYIVQMLRIANPETAIVTYCFNKNVKQSIINSKNRNFTNNNTLNCILDSINRLSKKYHPNSKFYYNKIPLVTFSGNEYEQINN